jgi:hypothetical protein
MSIKGKWYIYIIMRNDAVFRVYDSRPMAYMRFDDYKQDDRSAKYSLVSVPSSAIEMLPPPGTSLYNDADEETHRAVYTSGTLTWKPV